MKEAITDERNRNTAPYGNPRLRLRRLSGLLTWSDLTPLAWVSPRAHFKPFMALAIHKRLKLHVPRVGPRDCPFTKVPGSALTGGIWHQALRVSIADRSLPTASGSLYALYREELACRIGGRHPYGIYSGAGFCH
jgi:hypothetical protein